MDNKEPNNIIPKRRPETKPDPNRKDKLEAFDRLLTIMDELRENCPWDKKQTLESLRHLTIEETFELSDAIIENDLQEIRKELGDLMLHLAFYSRIGDEQKAFHMGDVLNGVCDKLIHRHPHIYDDVEANDEATVKANWEQIKLKEKKDASVLGGVPKSLPALIKAMRIQEKARGAGFDWDNKDQVWEKVQEELGEFEAETDRERQAAEFGDVLFSMINYARFVDINPEEALERTNKKFIQRFNYLETASKQDGKYLHLMTLEEMDAYWEEAKNKL
jgi:MazG family protein